MQQLRSLAVGVLVLSWYFLTRLVAGLPMQYELEAQRGGAADGKASWDGVLVARSRWRREGNDNALARVARLTVFDRGPWRRRAARGDSLVALDNEWSIRGLGRRRLLDANTTISTATVSTEGRGGTIDSQLGIGIMAGIFIAVGVVGFLALVIYRTPITEWVAGKRNRETRQENADDSIGRPSLSFADTPENKRKRLSAPRYALRTHSMVPMTNDLAAVPGGGGGNGSPPPPEADLVAPSPDYIVYNSTAVGHVERGMAGSSASSLYGNATSPSGQFGSFCDMSTFLGGQSGLLGKPADELLGNPASHGVTTAPAKTAAAHAADAGAGESPVAAGFEHGLVARTDGGDDSFQPAEPSSASIANAEFQCDVNTASNLPQPGTALLTSSPTLLAGRVYEDCFSFPKRSESKKAPGSTSTELASRSGHFYSTTKSRRGSDAAAASTDNILSADASDIYDVPSRGASPALSTGETNSHSSSQPAGATLPTSPVLPHGRLSQSKSDPRERTGSIAEGPDTLRKTVSEGRPRSNAIPKPKRKRGPSQVKHLVSNFERDLAVSNTDKHVKFRYAVKLTKEQQTPQGRTGLLGMIAQLKKRGSMGKEKPSVIESVQQVRLDHSVGVAIPASTARRSSSFPLSKIPTPPVTAASAAVKPPVLFASSYTSALPGGRMHYSHHQDDDHTDGPRQVRRQSFSVPLDKSCAVDQGTSPSGQVMLDVQPFRGRAASMSSMSSRHGVPLPSKPTASISSPLDDGHRQSLHVPHSPRHTSAPGITSPVAVVQADDGDVYMDMSARLAASPALADNTPGPVLPAAAGVAADEMYGSVEHAAEDDDIYATATPVDQCEDDAYMYMSAA